MEKNLVVEYPDRSCIIQQRNSSTANHTPGRRKLVDNYLYFSFFPSLISSCSLPFANQSIPNGRAHKDDTSGAQNSIEWVVKQK